MTLRFVHLSDMHFGQEKDGTLPSHEDVRAELLNDCRRLRADGIISGPADGILLTGDTAYGGKESEFKKAVEWLDELTGISGCNRLSVQTIPGNHDVDLETLDATGKLLQNSLRKSSIDEIQAYLNDTGSDSSNPLFRKLVDYRSFADAYSSDFRNSAQPISMKVHNLAGGRGLRFVGLCSVLISDRNDKADTMYLGQNQYIISRSHAHEDIIMVHHPLPWFKDKDRARKFINSRARVLMTGHEHYPALTVAHHEDGFQQIHIAAGAVNPPHAAGEYTYTYNWIEFAWIEEAGRAILAVTVYPRRWNATSTRFDPDYHRTEGQQSKTLKLDCGKGKADGKTNLTVRGSAEEDRESSAEGKAEAAVPAMEEAAMPASHTAEAESGNGDSFELLKFLFWRYLDRPTRQRLLVELGLLRASPRPLPTAFEREALELASQQGKLAALWDATMTQIPLAEQRRNPFSAT